jgi:2-dehydro-3-deoxyphosphogluconate aldolase/(4S)-4-hydroxy-2-oxoglutarate aldolase
LKMKGMNGKMTKAEITKKIVDIGIVPVVRAASAAQAIAAAEAVCAGGISVVEVTMTVPGAVEVIAQLVKTMGSAVLVGAGTVLDAGSARRCLDAGAQFLVSPGFDLETVKFANSQGVPMIAGALTPTEVITAWNAGSDLVKIFPCGNVGGAKYIKALKGPLPQIPMVPTGGVNLTTAAEFIQAGSAAVGVGGELILAAALKSGNTREITELAKQYVSIVREARGPKA